MTPQLRKSLGCLWLMFIASVAFCSAQDKNLTGDASAQPDSSGCHWVRGVRHLQSVPRRSRTSRSKAPSIGIRISKVAD